MKHILVSSRACHPLSLHCCSPEATPQHLSNTTVIVSQLLLLKPDHVSPLPWVHQWIPKSLRINAKTLLYCTKAQMTWPLLFVLAHFLTLLPADVWLQPHWIFRQPVHLLTASFPDHQGSLPHVEGLPWTPAHSSITVYLLTLLYFSRKLSLPIIKMSYSCIHLLSVKPHETVSSKSLYTVFIHNRYFVYIVYYYIIND